MSKQWFMLKIVNWNWQIKLESLAVHYRIINETQFHHIPFCHCRNEIGDSSPFMPIQRKIKMLPRMVYLCGRLHIKRIHIAFQFNVPIKKRWFNSSSTCIACFIFRDGILPRKTNWNILLVQNRSNHYLQNVVDMEYRVGVWEMRIKLKHRQM